MANFLTSFMSGGLKAATNQMYTLAEERGKILDDLRPKVQDTFTLLNNNTKKYSDIYKKVSKFDGGQSAFNYFFLGERNIIIRFPSSFGICSTLPYSSKS